MTLPENVLVCTINHYSLPENVLICTITHYYVGLRVDDKSSDFMILKNATWVVNTGRLSECLNSGKLAEVETPKDGIVWINKAAIVSIWEWKHRLP